MGTSKRIALILSLLACQFSWSQTIGGRDNSEMTPKAAEATKLSGGSFTGDVNTMTGELATSVALGSVSTPSGLGYSLSLDYNSSFSMSTTQPMTAGIPYGDGWGPNIPTISIESDVFRKFRCGDLEMFGGGTLSPVDLDFGDTSDGYSASDEGDLYWFSPQVNIPGVASGRAIFKYVDVDDKKCMVFVLNKFETSVEIRFYGGNGWQIRLANGDTYNLDTHLANYSAPSSQRVLFYDQDGTGNLFNPLDPQALAATNNSYANPAQIQNVVEPKSTYSVWYCTKIYNTNSPGQTVNFSYDKYGKFNYFQEFNQERYEEVRSEVFLASTNTDFSAYTDVFLKYVTSSVRESMVDIIELDYKTFLPAVDNAVILSESDPLVFPKDGLYNYKVIEDWGGDFTGWKRYKHSAVDNYDVPSVGNPYVSESNPLYRYVTVPTSSTDVPFDHGFLESERLFSSGSGGYYPGDVYEVKTTVTRPSSTDLDNGNGTIDIAIKTGTHGNNPSNEFNETYYSESSPMSISAFEQKKGVEIFSTFNSAVKWQMGYGEAVLETSNLFVMPNIPTKYFGFNIQIGPGNSDIDYSSNSQSNPNMSLFNPLNVMAAYPYAHGGRDMKSTDQIPHNFGTGHPWAMMIPEYNEMALNSVNPLTGSTANFEELYDTWWATPYETGVNPARVNIPTKFDAEVKLTSVQLIRYSKNALMLQGVRVYKVNGEFKGLEDVDKIGWQLVSQKQLDYSIEQEKIIRNYAYDNGETIQNENLLRRIILLSKISEVPVGGILYATDFGLTQEAAAQVLTTFLNYDKYLDSQNNPNPTYNSDFPYRGMNQYLLTSYTDHLGGITRAEYYPIEDNSTRIQNNYAFNSCSNYIYSGNNTPGAEPFGKNNSFTVHAAVHYLSKNDEGDELLNSSSVLQGGALNPDLKVWEYVYDLNSKMHNTRKIVLPQEHFRHNELFGEQSAFQKVRVYSPFVNSTDATRSYTDYEYYGDLIGSGSVPTLDEYLYYGKLKTIKNYSLNGVLEDETIFNYAYTLAFENAYDRPNFMRERLWNENLLEQNYEYRDIYKNDVLEYVDGQNTYVGEQAYPFQSVPFLSGNYSDKEKPKFLEFYFYNDLTTLNEPYMFNSYFVKKASEINRVYDNSLSILPTSNPPIIGVTEMPADDPVGAGFVNIVEDDEVYDAQFIDMIGQVSDEQLESDFIAGSPLSDAVLIALIKSSVRGTHISNVLQQQGDLSNAVWQELILAKGNYSTSELTAVVYRQSSLYDQVQMDLLNAISIRTDYVLVNSFLLKNGFLSGQVVNLMLNLSVSMPAESFTDVLSSQPQMPESVLINIINCANTKSINLNAILSGQFVTTTMYSHILTNTTYTAENVTELVEGATSFPTDITLIEFIEHVPQFTVSQLTRIFAKADRDIGDDVAAKIDLHFSIPIKFQLLEGLEIANSLSQYCGGTVITGRTYIETKKEFEYYEADYTGIAVGQAYEILLGLKENAFAPDPFPFDTDPVSEGLSLPVETITGLTLKHEPSWQLFSVKTSSPQMEGAYSREEYFYLYDLENRYDRHWYNYDLDNPAIDYIVTTYTQGSGASALSEILVTNDKWDYYYGSQLIPEIPTFDGMDKTRKSGDRNTAFQKTTISKNTRDIEPKYRSEYYQYDSRWIFNDLTPNAQTVLINEPCIAPPPPPPPSNPTDPCLNYEDCSDCYPFFYKPFTNLPAIVPIGYCAWEIPNSGFYICPSDHDVLLDYPGATLLHCETVPTPNAAMQPSQALKDVLLLRDVSVQVDDIDHNVSQEFENSKLDENNSYVAEFYLGSPNVVDANNFIKPHHMIMPFDQLKVRTVKERNRYTQVELEQNSIGLQTKYFYNTVTALWNVDVACPANNYLSFQMDDIGLPTKIEVGYTKTDAIITDFEYTPIGLLQKVTGQSGSSMEYEFDNYHRLKKTKENGQRVLSSFEYNTWNNDELLSFNQRTDLNFVQSTIFNSTSSFDYERLKAFVDPLGRNQGTALGYDVDDYNHISIHSGYLNYDNLGRTINSEKTYLNSLSSSSAGSPVLLKSQFQSNPIEALNYETGMKGRVIRNSNYGVDVNGIHAVKSKYDITNNIYASCELNLSLYELGQVMSPNGTTNTKMYRTELYDQDDKQSIEYVNSLGQKVATLRYNGGGQKIVTLFTHDSYGNLTKVINPEKQESDYIYNKLGQLVIEKTIDAGSKHYMYNKQGLVSITLDEQGRNNKNALGDADPFYRVYEYDDYGRLTKQGRSTINGENHSITFGGELFGPLHYQDASVWTAQGVAIIDPLTSIEVYFDYTFSDAQTQDWLYQFDYFSQPNIVQTNGLSGNEMSVDFREKTLNYGGIGGTNEHGKLISSLSFNDFDGNIQSQDYLYDDYGNLKKQTVSFNPEGSVLGGPESINSVIEYPNYNFRHSLLEQKVDVNNDGTVDFHCFMKYDALNRLEAVYGAAGLVGSSSQATLIVSYSYDDAIGTVKKKVHSIQDLGLSAIANEIAYSYDERDRLTNIKAGQFTAGTPSMMDYDLFYDDQLVNYNDGVYSASANADQNWNGNINGTSTSYDFISNQSVANSVSGFDLPTVYGYRYDGINRMLSADGTVGDLLDAGNLAESYLIGDVTLMYDRIGNIKSLHRTMRNTDMTPGANYTMLQHFNYAYQTNTNRLIQATGVTGSGTTSRNYTYDKNGNILTDDSKNLIASRYDRASYPTQLTIDPDDDPLTLDDETISYLYSANDLRIYKKDNRYNSSLSAYESHEDYYLVDGMGRTVAIFKKGFNGQGWEYYSHGSEREARLIPTEVQKPGFNTTLTDINLMQFGKDQATFYVNDHLGNTRITYTPTSTYGTPNIILNDEFIGGSLNNWVGFETAITNSVGDLLTVATDINATNQSISKTLSPNSLNAGETYVLTLDANLGDTPNGVKCTIIGGEEFDLTQGSNTHQFVADGTTPIISFSVIGGNNQLVSFTYSIDNIVIGQQMGNFTFNTVEYVADYFPYGKALREFVNGDRERYISTQHERDAETGFDYRGARYYDSDVARFLSLDPLKMKFDSWSDYNYVLGNPLRYIDPNGKSPTDEFIINYDKNGKRTSEKISNLGGDKFNFMHIKGGVNDGKTYLKDLKSKKGTFMSTSEFILGYAHISSGSDFSDIFSDFMSGNGPEKSLIQGGDMITELRNSPQFDEAKKEYYRSGKDKIRIEGEFGLSGAYKAGSNMTSQMIGSCVYNFYTVGDYVVVMALDSKSKSSFSVNPFDGDSSNIKRKPNGGPPQSTTYQTYLFYFKR